MKKALKRHGAPRTITTMGYALVQGGDGRTGVTRASKRWGATPTTGSKTRTSRANDGSERCLAIVGAAQLPISPEEAHQSPPKQGVVVMKTVAFFVAAALTAAPAFSAKQCHDEKGRFTKCPTSATSANTVKGKDGKCRVASGPKKGQFTRC
jgi:hypothetical protein